VNLDLRTLQLFVAVVEEQTVAKAAKREHIAASAVSKRIADLEKEVKVDLFRRHRTGLEPTPAGHALLHHARMLMRNLAQLETELGDYEHELRGSIRIFANISGMVQYLPDDLSRFLTQHPLVRVDLEEAISPLIVRAVADGVAEIGIFGGSIPARGLTVLPYRQDRLVVVVSPRHPLRKQPSVGCWWTTSPGGGRRPVIADRDGRVPDHDARSAGPPASKRNHVPLGQALVAE
jgi:DNA-binding transcriptional LysR family regulator